MDKESAERAKRSAMDAKAEMRTLMWEAFPPRMHDNRKSWFTRIGQALAWNPRRVRAIWHGEARVITAEELLTVQRRVAEQRAALRRIGERHDELHALVERATAPLAGDDAPEGR